MPTTRRLAPLLLIPVIALLVLGAFTLLRTPPEPDGIRQERPFAGGTLLLVLDADTVGERQLDLIARDSTGSAVAFDAARLRFHMRDMEMGTIETELDRVAAGRFRGRGSFFTMAGTWQIEATLLRAGTPLSTTFELGIAAPGELAGPANPFLSDRTTIAAGQRIYLANCASCHGPLGNGDGPASAGLSPRPPKFADHMTRGKHTDGQIFTWIRDGYRSGSSMPAWGKRLSDEQIWQLVIFLRTFGGPPPGATAQPGQPQTAPTVPLPTLPPPVPDAFEPIPPAVFVRNGNLWLSNGDGQPRQITQLPSDQYAQYPAIAPAGDQVAFSVVIPQPITSTALVPASAVYLMPLAGGTPRQIIRSDALYGAPRWLPDNRTLLVSIVGLPTDPNQLGDIGAAAMLIDSTTGQQRQLVRNGLDASPSADGRQITYLTVGEDGFTQRLMIADADGSNARVVLEDPAFSSFYAPRFTPNGQQIIVAAIGVPGLDGTLIPGNTPTPGIPTAEPTGAQNNHPATVAAHGLPWDVWIVNTDGSGLRRFAQIGEDLPLTSISADGREAVIMAANGVYRLNVDGSNVRRIDPVGDHGGLDLIRP